MIIFISLFPPLFILTLINHYASKDVRSQFNTIKALLLGTLIVLPIAILETMAMPEGLPTSYNSILASHFLIVGPIEEIGKLFIVYYIIKYAKTKEELYPINMITCSLAGAMGFAMLENLMYITEGGLSTGILRAITSIPMHASTSLIIGYYGYREHSLKEKNGWIKGFTIAVIMHGFYNSFATIFNESFMFIGIFIIVIFYIFCSFNIVEKMKRYTEKLVKEELILEIDNINE